MRITKTKPYRCSYLKNEIAKVEIAQLPKDLSQEKIPITSITKIHVQDTISRNRSFTDGVLVGAGICILPIAILSIGNPEVHYGLIFAGVASPIMVVLGGLTSLILPKRARTKVYCIQ